MCPCHGPCICLKEHLELEGAREQAGVALTMSVISKSELKKTAYPYVQSCTSCMFRYIRRDLASRRQTQTGKAHTPKEGRGQRQRRKKRDGAGPDGQPSASSKPGKAAVGTRLVNAAGHVAAADVRPAKRLRQTRDPAGTNALHPALCHIESMHLQRIKVRSSDSSPAKSNHINTVGTLHCLPASI